MATNVTTDPVEYMKQRLSVTESNLNKTIKRITNYNNSLPEKNKIAAETLEKRKAKRAARPEKYAGKKPLPEDPKVLVPLDINTCTEVIGLKNQIEAYNYFIDILIGCVPNSINTEYNMKFLNNKIKDYSIKYSCAKKRLDKNRNKLKQNKINNPKKYGKRPDLPLVNREMINAERALNHYQKILYLITGINPKQVTKPFNIKFRNNKKS